MGIHAGCQEMRGIEAIGTGWKLPLLSHIPQGERHDNEKSQ